ncbi:MAG: hypothetical protein ACR2GW_03890 [Pyrinomonadaceae bacterium]|jgi:hypothetical protein|nr:hypothetical protein [Acidobacteriota bacterium]MDQ3584760.1 hypothetical protein [Acidobacteriota bacterium]
MEDVAEDKSKGSDSGGGETALERLMNRYVGDAIHIFLSLLAVVILGVAVVSSYNLLAHEIPKLFAPFDDYKVLYGIIENLLLIAIAAELGLLLLFHRTSSAVEVIIFIIARKMISPGNTAVDLMLEVTALSALLIVRFYFLPGRPK